MVLPEDFEVVNLGPHQRINFEGKFILGWGPRLTTSKSSGRTKCSITFGICIPPTEMKKGGEKTVVAAAAKLKRDTTSATAKTKKSALKTATTANAAMMATGGVTVQLPSAMSTPAKSVCLNDLRNVLSSTDHPACVRPQCPHQHLSSSPKTLKFSRSNLIIPAATKTAWAKSPANLKTFTDLLDAHRDKRLTT